MYSLISDHRREYFLIVGPFNLREAFCNKGTFSSIGFLQEDPFVPNYFVIWGKIHKIIDLAFFEVLSVLHGMPFSIPIGVAAINMQCPCNGLELCG